MIRLFDRFSHSTAGFVLALLFLAAVGAVYFFPASYWFTVERVQVENSKVGQPVSMTVKRTVNTAFVGSWYVTVRQWDGAWVPYCAARGDAYYQPDSRLPADLTLTWWTDEKPRCSNLPVGKYEMLTRWVIKGKGILPDKEISMLSNTFLVNP